MQLCNMVKIEKEEVEFPACATLWQGNYIRWQHLSVFMYIVQLYKEDWRILRMLGCRAVGLHSTEQIVQFLFTRSVCASYCLHLHFLFKSHKQPEQWDTNLSDTLS